MNLQVLPLRVLVSRQVIRDRMDYTGYLAGKTKSEMDVLDRLAGRVVVQSSELTVERYLGAKENKDEDKWDGLHEWELPASSLKSFLYGETADISIVDTSGYGGRRWDISDVDGLKKSFLLRSEGHVSRFLTGKWIHTDSFIEDGKLITNKKVFAMEGEKVAFNKVALDEGHPGLVMEFFDSFSTDKQGNLVREFSLGWPMFNIKITRVMSALRVVSSFRHCVLL